MKGNIMLTIKKSNDNLYSTFTLEWNKKNSIPFLLCRIMKKQKNGIKCINNHWHAWNDIFNLIPFRKINARTSSLWYEYVANAIISNSYRYHICFQSPLSRKYEYSSAKYIIWILRFFYVFYVLSDIV